MPKFSNTRNYDPIQILDSFNIKEISEVRSDDSPILSYYFFLRIGLVGPGIRYPLPGRCDGSKLMNLMLH